MMGISDRFVGIFSKIRGKKKLTEENISDAVREVRVALLEADVNYGVVKAFIKRIKEKVAGTELLQSVTPGQQFVKHVHDELVALMGEDEVLLDLAAKPAVVMMCGLQGSGKTTQSAKLAKFVMRQYGKKKPLLVACDLQRPAAVQQLKMLGEQIGVEVFAGEGDPVLVAKNALTHAKANDHDVVFVDTAGRLHLDEELMLELENLKRAIDPQETLFVANATIGQDAVNVAADFNQRIEITGTILTMLDGNARGGAAISIKEVTGKPLKFEGIGETLDDIQVFNPSSMADRILGMGDTINLVRKAQEHIDEDQAKALEKKLRSASFSYMDYLTQIQMVKKMGSFSSLMNMLPGMSKLKNLNLDERELGKVEAIILSMTLKEREGTVDLIPRRRKRVARGSGTSIDDVNRLAKSFKQMKQMMKKMPNMKQMQKMLGGAV
ncbi:MAG: Signal recognition particle protein [Chlamydiae bacterium]|nr:Signal recognition particle protein [Chlamydiota bacterium]